MVRSSFMAEARASRPAHSFRAGFSLIEVVLALGVVSFCLMPIFGLLMVGIAANQGIIRETTAANLAADVSNDLHATCAAMSSSPYYSLQVPSTGDPVINTLYLAADGTSVQEPSANAPTYLATIVVTPPPVSSPLSACTARILITWPALPNQAKGALPTHYQNSFQTVIGLSRN